MKKKLVATMLIATMALSMVACAGEKDETSVSKVQEQQEASASESSEVTEQSEAAEKGSVWETRDMEALVLEDVAIEAVPGNGEETGNKVRTPFNYDVAQIKDSLNNNAYISERYLLAQQTYENGKGKSDRLTGRSYTRRDCIVGADKATATDTQKYFQDYEVTFVRDVWGYENYNEIRMSFTADVTSNFQADMESVVKTVYGEELGEYLVYAKDSDGMASGSKLNQEISMEELIDAGAATYRVGRYMGEESDGEMFVSFYINVADVETRLGYVDESYERVLDTLAYKPEDVISPMFAAADLHNQDRFAADYAAPLPIAYEYTDDSGYVASVLTADNGVKKTSFSIDFNPLGDSGNKGADHHINYSVSENANGIFHVSLEFRGEPGKKGYVEGSDEEKYDKLWDIVNQLIGSVFPDMGIEPMTYATTQEEKTSTGSIRREVEYTVCGMPVKGTVSYGIDDCEFAVNLEGEK